MPLISAVCYSKLSYFFVYVYWEYICTCIQALHQYIKSHSATKDYNYMYLVQWCLLLTIKKGPDDFLWHSSKVDIWRWNMCVFLAWSIWFAWWTSTQCRSMPYFRQWYWRVGNVSFRSAALSTSNSALSKCFISIFFKS